MSSRMVARGGKTRLILIVAVSLLLTAVLYLFHETKSELESTRNSASSCSRQLESISSQLQVLVEQKLKLERSLEDEKREHIKTKEDLNELIQDEKHLRDKQNFDNMIRYNELERNHEALQVEDKKLRLDLETMKTDIANEEKKNVQLTQELNEVKSQLVVQDFQNGKMKLDSGKEIVENNESNNLPKSNEFSDLQLVKKISDNANVTKAKSGSVTPAINPQAIDGATAKSSTPMISSLKVVSTNGSLFETDEANPINQPSMEINSVKLSDGSQNLTIPKPEPIVFESESMKAMPAPPQEDTVKKEQSNNIEEDKLSKQKNHDAYKDEYEQERHQEDEDDDDDFDAKEESQHNIRYT